MYLTQCAQSHSKLKLSKPSVKRLIYVPCSMSGGVSLPDAFRGLEPACVRKIDQDQLIKLRGMK